MCGRFALTATGQELADLFGLAEPPFVAPRYNIAPTQPVAAVRRSRHTGEREFTHFRWGLIPSWAKDVSIGNRLINARSETAAEKPSFRAAFKYRRCLVPASGFFEWRRENGGKQPYYVQLDDGRPFAIAGLWEHWQDAEGSEIETCTLLTTSPNELIRPLHNRMPVIIHPDDFDDWLAAEDGAEHLLRPFDGAPMAAQPVSTIVNNPRNDLPDCITPISA